MFPFLDFGYLNPAVPAFQWAKRTAANIPAPGESGAYTVALFKADFPEFCRKVETETPAEPDGEGDGETLTETVTTYELLLPEATVQRYIDAANNSVLPSRWAESWRDAVGLYVAHLCALRMQTYADGSVSQSAAASNAGQVGVVSSAKMGDTSIAYDNGAINAGTEKWGTWNATKYGAQFITMARMIGIGGVYAI